MLVNWRSELLFLLPGVSWALALLPFERFKTTHLLGEALLWITLYWALWMGMIFLVFVLGGNLILFSKQFAFPLIGGIGAVCSLLLYGRMTGLGGARSIFLLSFLLGYLSVCFFVAIKPEASLAGSDLPLLVFLWQLFVSESHTRAFLSTARPVVIEERNG